MSSPASSYRSPQSPSCSARPSGTTTIRRAVPAAMRPAARSLRRRILKVASARSREPQPATGGQRSPGCGRRLPAAPRTRLRPVGLRRHRIPGAPAQTLVCLAASATVPLPRRTRADCTTHTNGRDAYRHMRAARPMDWPAARMNAHRNRMSWRPLGLALIAAAGLAVLIGALHTQIVALVDVGSERVAGTSGQDENGLLSRTLPSPTASPEPTAEAPLVDGGPPHVQLWADLTGEARVGAPMTATLAWSLPTSAFGDVQGVHSGIAVTVTFVLPSHYVVSSVSAPCDVCDDRSRGGTVCE